MVVGINKFKEYFKDYPGNYVIIGGTGCDIINDLPEPSIFDRNGFGRQDMNIIFRQLVKSFNLDMNE